MAQNINNQDERVNQLTREMFISARGRMLPSDAFLKAEMFIEHLAERESKAKLENDRRVQGLLARNNRPRGSI